MNKHLPKLLLFFLACFCEQAKAVWIPRHQFIEELRRRSLSLQRPFDCAFYVWAHYPSWVPWQTDIPTVAKFLAFLEGADSDIDAVSNDLVLQAKRISVLADLKEVLLQIFYLIIGNKGINPIEHARHIDSFNAGFVIDHNFFRDLGKYFNEFVHAIEALQDAPYRAIVKRDIYKRRLNIFVQKIMACLSERIARSGDQADQIIKYIRSRLVIFLRNYSHDLNILNVLEDKFKQQEDSEALPYYFERQVRDLANGRSLRHEWTIFSSNDLNVGDLRLQKRQFAIVVDFLTAFKFQLYSLFPFSEELIVSSVAHLCERSSVLQKVDPSLFTDATGLGDVTGEDLSGLKSEHLKGRIDKIKNARAGNPQ